MGRQAAGQAGTEIRQTSAYLDLHAPILERKGRLPGARMGEKSKRNIRREKCKSEEVCPE